MSNFWDLVNIEEFWDRRQEFNMDRGDVTFYCKDCEKKTQVDRPNPKGYIFVCRVCSWKNVAIGTLEWINERFKIKS